MDTNPSTKSPRKYPYLVGDIVCIVHNNSVVNHVYMVVYNPMNGCFIENRSGNHKLNSDHYYIISVFNRLSYLLVDGALLRPISKLIIPSISNLTNKKVLFLKKLLDIPQSLRLRKLFSLQKASSFPQFDKLVQSKNDHEIENINGCLDLNGSLYTSTLANEGLNNEIDSKTIDKDVINNNNKDIEAKVDKITDETNPKISSTYTRSKKTRVFNYCSVCYGPFEDLNSEIEGTKKETGVIECKGTCNKAFHRKCLGLNNKLNNEHEETSFHCDSCLTSIYYCFICHNRLIHFNSKTNQLSKTVFCPRKICQQYYHSECLFLWNKCKASLKTSSSDQILINPANQPIDISFDFEIVDFKFYDSTQNLPLENITTIPDDIINDFKQLNIILFNLYYLPLSKILGSVSGTKKLISCRNSLHSSKEESTTKKFEEALNSKRQRMSLDIHNLDKPVSKKGRASISSESYEEVYKMKMEQLYDNRGFLGVKNGFNKDQMCQKHECNYCWRDKVNGYGRMVYCVACPTVYHSESCLVAGTRLINDSWILCIKCQVREYWQIIDNSNSVCIQKPSTSIDYCAVCSIGGNLICCESCPLSFHAECIGIDSNIINSKSFWKCDDCLEDRWRKYNDFVWVKYSHFCWWPAKILHPKDIPTKINNSKLFVTDFAVYFFGAHNYGWVRQGQTFHYAPGDKGKSFTTSKNIDEVFNNGLQEISDAFLKVKAEKLEKIKNMKPPSYKYLKSNWSVIRVDKKKTEYERMICECIEGPNACTIDSQCVNVLMNFECYTKFCRAKLTCQNQKFQKNEYANCEPHYFGDRGWGLVTKQFIKKSDFVIEYTGELIDKEICQERIEKYHKFGIDDYYILVINKNYIVDAYPGGNESRFMNHSCDPNCETQIWTVLGEPRVGLFAKRDIEAGQELTFNYNLESLGFRKKVCLCKSSLCSGFIGVPPKERGGRTFFSSNSKVKKNGLQKNSADNSDSEKIAIDQSNGGSKHDREMETIGSKIKVKRRHKRGKHVGSSGSKRKIRGESSHKKLLNKNSETIDSDVIKMQKHVDELSDLLIKRTRKKRSSIHSNGKMHEDSSLDIKDSNTGNAETHQKHSDEHVSNFISHEVNYLFAEQTVDRLEMPKQLIGVNDSLFVEKTDITVKNDDETMSNIDNTTENCCIETNSSNLDNLKNELTNIIDKSSVQIQNKDIRPSNISFCDSSIANKDAFQDSKEAELSPSLVDRISSFNVYELNNQLTNALFVLKNDCSVIDDEISNNKLDSCSKDKNKLTSKIFEDIKQFDEVKPIDSGYQNTTCLETIKNDENNLDHCLITKILSNNLSLNNDIKPSNETDSICLSISNHILAYNNEENIQSTNNIISSPPKNMNFCSLAPNDKTIQQHQQQIGSVDFSSTNDCTN